MARIIDPLAIPCPLPECRIAAGKACNRKAGVLMGETTWHPQRYLERREQVLAREPLDPRPWCERTLTSIVAELKRQPGG